VALALLMPLLVAAMPLSLRSSSRILDLATVALGVWAIGVLIASGRQAFNSR
jgi:hypothetical protein